MRLRVLAISLATTLASLLLATGAFAADGEGWYGETDDRVVTAFGLGLVLLFTFMVVVFSWLQGRGDKRKDEKKAAQARQRAGW
jgi:fatty acid desaturase